MAWTHPTTGLRQPAAPIEGGGFALLKPPFVDGLGAVALLRR
jgi:hypothetical protein